MTLAMEIAREIVRGAIKAKGLDMKEWPATRINEAAKALLRSQSEDGKIITAARRPHVFGWWFLHRPSCLLPSVAAIFVQAGTCSMRP
jgi:hypothetical protein